MSVTGILVASPPHKLTCLLSFLISLLLHPSPTACHPLCLDAEPPFSFTGTTVNLDFCTEYSLFGCCTRDDDQRIRSVYDEYVSKATPTSQNCTSYLRTLLCLECSPYAAHVFDAEGATTTTSRKYFPGLCQSYCTGLYRNCRDVIPYVSSSSRIQQAVAAGEQSFCTETKISDMTYCYPDIINNTDLNQALDRQQSSEQGCLCLEPLAGHLRNALILVYPDDNTGRLFIGEQLGLVSIYYKNGTRVPDLFMDISFLVLTSSSPGDERGFLGMVFHPKFSSNQKLYVYFSIGQSGSFRTRISEFQTLSNNPNKVDVNSERVLLEIDQPYSNHNGGQLLFGYDGYLYVTVGDGGAGGDPNNYAQNLTTLLGKVLRIDVDTMTNSRQYGIPASNPFSSTPNARPEIYAYGMRNTWRCSFDRGDFQTGAGRARLFCGDVGQSRYEEVDIVKSGLNYGWRGREGFECYDSNLCGRIGPEEYPIFAYGRDLGQSITGGYVYRGCNYPSLNGLYIYGDYSSGRIFRLRDSGSSVWENKEVLMCGSDYCTNGLRNTYERNLLSFGEDFDGDVYVLATSNPSPTSFSGSVYRLVDPLRRNDPTVCTRSSASSTPPPLTSTSPPTTTTTTTVAAPTPTRVSSTSSSSSSSLSTTTIPAATSTTTVAGRTTVGGTTTNNSSAIWACGFEDAAGGSTWCGIQQATDDNFDWTINSGPTPSNPTGPDQAYTGSFYIFIETSNPRAINDTAKIYLPIPPSSATPSGTFCLTFAYHMFGFHVREIRLITEHSTGGATTVWSQAKQKGNFWLRAAVTLSLQSGARVGFVGVRGDEYSGDIGLDDLKLMTGSC